MLQKNMEDVMWTRTSQQRIRGIAMGRQGDRRKKQHSNKNRKIITFV